MRRWMLATTITLLWWAPARTSDAAVHTREVVEWLCQGRWEGRGNGSAALDSLAAELRSRLSALGPVRVQRFAGPQGHELVNLVCLRPGSDAQSGWIILGAHYDHLGLGEEGGPHPGEGYVGADDNASGVAVAMEVLERLGDAGSRSRNLGVVFFAGEEVGLLGSRAFVAEPGLEAGPILAMINLDSVGRLRDGGLSVFGVDSASIFASTLDGINSAYGLKIEKIARSSGASDDATFAEAGIPTLHFFTGAHAEYHRPTDQPAVLDFDGLEVVADFVTDLLDYLADSETPLDFLPPGSASARPDPAKSSGGRRRVSFGSIPDFAFPGPGVKITGVLPESPAASAGLAAGDVITSFGGEVVQDLTDYSEAMKQFSPGDQVVIEFLRQGTRHSVEVELVERR